MTGRSILSLRRRLGMTKWQLAEVLGVHGMTVYRWERHAGPLRIEPLQVSILTALRRESERRASPEQRSELGDLLRGALAVGGTLLALGALAKLLFPEPARRRRKQRSPRRKR